MRRSTLEDANPAFGGSVALIFAAILYAGLVLHVNPPSNIETIDPKILHLSAEFTEANLGTKIEAAGQVTTLLPTLEFTYSGLESARYCMCWPPLIAILAPVTNAASSEHR